MSLTLYWNEVEKLVDKYIQKNSQDPDLIKTLPILKEMIVAGKRLETVNLTELWPLANDLKALAARLGEESVFPVQSKEMYDFAEEYKNILKAFPNYINALNPAWYQPALTLIKKTSQVAKDEVATRLAILEKRIEAYDQRKKQPDTVAKEVKTEVKTTEPTIAVTPADITDRLNILKQVRSDVIAQKISFNKETDEVKARLLESNAASEACAPAAVIEPIEPPVVAEQSEAPLGPRTLREQLQYDVDALLADRHYLKLKETKKDLDATLEQRQIDYMAARQEQVNLFEKQRLLSEFSYRLSLAEDQSYILAGPDQETVDDVFADFLPQLTQEEFARWQHNQQLLGWNIKGTGHYLYSFISSNAQRPVAQRDLFKHFLEQHQQALTATLTTLENIFSQYYLKSEKMSEVNAQIDQHERTIKETRDKLTGVDVVALPIMRAASVVSIAPSQPRQHPVDPLEAFRAAMNSLFDRIIAKLTKLIVKTERLNNRFEDALRDLFEVDSGNVKKSYSAQIKRFGVHANPKPVDASQDSAPQFATVLERR